MRKRYEPRRVIAPTTPRDRAMQRNNANLNALLSACEELVQEWNYGTNGAVPIDGLVFRIEEALTALGRIREDD